MSRYDLTDVEWRAIEPLLPNTPRGVLRVDDRRVLNGIFWVLRSGAPWRNLPERYGPRTTCYNRFARRRWILKAKPAAIAIVDRVYIAHAKRTAALLDDYSEEEFDAALRFMNRLAEELKLTAIELAKSRPGGND